VPNNLAAFNAQAWSKLLVANLDRINVMMPLINKDYEGELKGVGDTVKVRTLGSITTGAYTKNSTSIAYQDLAPTVENMTVSDAQYFAFKVDDVDKAQNDLSAMQLYTQRAAVALNDKIEDKLLSYYASVNASNKITGASDAAIALSASNIYGYCVDARTKLSKQNVPATGRWMVVDPDTVALLLKSTEFTRATNLGDAVVQNGSVNGAINQPGFIGRIAGFDVYESNAVPVASGAKYIQFGDRYAISYAAALTELESIRLQDSFATAVRGLLVHDAKVFAEAAKRFGYIKAVA
jgi:hypothetical protein